MTRPDFSIHHVARLARLELEPAEADVLQAQLDKVLAYVGKLQELDLGPPAGDDPPPADRDPLRDDRPRRASALGLLADIAGLVLPRGKSDVWS